MELNTSVAHPVSYTPRTEHTASLVRAVMTDDAPLKWPHFLEIALLRISQVLTVELSKMKALRNQDLRDNLKKAAKWKLCIVYNCCPAQFLFWLGKMKSCVKF